MEEHDDFAFEPQPGLPAPLPPGEKLLWQGKPIWTRLAIEAFHCRKVAIYFALIAVFVIVSDVSEGARYSAIVDDVLLTLALGTVAVGILATLAWLSARVTIYSITNKRVLMRFGVSLQLTINLPFTRIRSADVRADRTGTGDIPLQLNDSEKVSYFVLWPHVRPRHLAHPQPMLRALPDVATTARLLADAVQADVAARRSDDIDLQRADASLPAASDKTPARSAATSMSRASDMAMATDV